ncbi:MAG: hypothetical protein SWE60_20275 [Thermodesulfobacteriota bacterium]|nr:hypothetical protein [Thermodesulfobacteriota bacterium]
MTSKNKEPIDLLKRRADKLLEQERLKPRKKGERERPWTGAEFAAEVASIKFTDEVLKGVKTFMCSIASIVREAESIREVERPCFGLTLLLLRDYDHIAFDKLLQMMKEQIDGQ